MVRFRCFCTCVHERCFLHGISPLIIIILFLLSSRTDWHMPQQNQVHLVYILLFSDFENRWCGDVAAVNVQMDKVICFLVRSTDMFLDLDSFWICNIIVKSNLKKCFRSHGNTFVTTIFPLFCVWICFWRCGNINVSDKVNLIYWGQEENGEIENTKKMNKNATYIHTQCILHTYYTYTYKQRKILHFDYTLEVENDKLQIE